MCCSGIVKTTHELWLETILYNTHVFRPVGQIRWETCQTTYSSPSKHFFTKDKIIWGLPSLVGKGENREKNSRIIFICVPRLKSQTKFDQKLWSFHNFGHIFKALFNFCEKGAQLILLRPKIRKDAASLHYTAVTKRNRQHLTVCDHHVSVVKICEQSITSGLINAPLRDPHTHSWENTFL